MMESQLNQLIVSEPLLEAVRARGRFRFDVDALPILDEPRARARLEGEEDS